MYKIIWIVYWFLLTPFTIGILFYSFWANGWFGGPQAGQAKEYESPRTCGERLSCCWRACS